MNMDISKFQNSECEDIDCYITNKQCYNSIFETNKPYVGIFDQLSRRGIKKLIFIFFLNMSEILFENKNNINLCFKIY